MRLILFLILLPAFLKSQDTIYYNKGSIATGTVVNILPKKVMCLQQKNVGVDDVLVIDKSTVERIHFKTGEIHYLNRGVLNPNNKESTPRLLDLEGRIYYYGERVQDSTMLRVIHMHPDKSRIPSMLGEYKKMMKYKKIQRSFFAGGIAIAAPLAGYAFADFFLSGLFGGSMSQTGAILAGCSVAVLATTIPISVHFKKKRFATRKRLIEYYNFDQPVN